MSFFADIYVAARSRDAHWITTLLDTFLGPSRSTSTGSLLVEGVEVDAPDEFVRRLVANPALQGAWYWRATGRERQAHCHFTADGGLILGLSCPEDTEEQELFAEMKRVFGAADGYVTYESPPEQTLAEFLRAARQA